MKTLFAVSDPTEVIILHAAVLEAKLPLLSDNRDLSASSILAGLAEQLSEALRDIPQWGDDSWRSLSPKHAAWEPAVSRALSDHEYLRTATPQQKTEYVRLLLAPYRNDEATVRVFLERVESILRERIWYQLWLRKSSPFGDGVAFLRERADGNFVALDSARTEITAAKSLLDVTDVLIERGFHPLGFYVEGLEPHPSERTG